jgi:hypothetical protein
MRMIWMLTEKTDSRRIKCKFINTHPPLSLTQAPLVFIRLLVSVVSTESILHSLIAFKRFLKLSGQT